MLLRLSVILFTGGGLPSHNAMGQADSTIGRPSFYRQIPPPLTQKADTPPRYGQPAGGTQSTGMHTCLKGLK